MRRKINEHAFLTCSTTLLLCFAASAQNRGRLTGSVFDAETGKPLEGTNVIVKGTNLGAAADRQGRYTITHLSPKLALVVAPAVNHTFRATFNQVFQSPNYPEGRRLGRSWRSFEYKEANRSSGVVKQI